MHYQQGFTLRRFIQASVLKTPTSIFLFNFFILLLSLINNLSCTMIYGDTIFYFPITTKTLKSRLKSCCYMSNQVVPKQSQADTIWSYQEAATRRCFVRKVLFKNFVIFIGKHLRRSLFFNNFAVILKKRLRHRCFYEIYKKTFFVEHIRWLLLPHDSKVSSS